MLLAGKDTTSSALTWFFWLISKNPQVESKIREELKASVPVNEAENWRLFNPQELNSLVYLHGALCESLRLYPPVPFQHKAPLQEDVLPSGHQVNSEMKIVLCLYAMGRMKSIWGEDCLKFKPERWITEGGKVKHEPSYKFLAFNAGPRTCLGKEVAFTQMKTVVATVIHNYHVQAVEGHPVSPNVSIILQMKHGFKVYIRCYIDFSCRIGPNVLPIEFPEDEVAIALDYVEEVIFYRHILPKLFCPRTCLGKDIAFTKMKVMAAVVIHNYNVEVVEGHLVALNCTSIILHVKHGLKMRKRLTNMFWVHPHNTAAYEEFFDVVSVDTNRYRMLFVSIVRANHYGQSILLGYLDMTKEYKKFKEIGKFFNEAANMAMEGVLKLQHIRAYLENLKLDFVNWDGGSDDSNENINVNAMNEIDENV
ncbi:hypothetical protein GH714_037236 [Hevea brasiliensis]|uniref:Uncharacterized protein n=1 Tax=Hevea brasiliensis TaxID=3981 RepID=A0A6A6KVX4_HEVBR|nr:hypothetical protein GH714_037236 [Hevea brasiliensis]